MKVGEIPFNGISMIPTLKSGDQLEIDFFSKPQFIRNPKKHLGEVLLYKEDKEWVVHRLVLCHSRYVLKGDNSMSSRPLEGVLVWGQVKSIMRGKRKIKNWNSTFQKKIKCQLSKWITEDSILVRRASKIIMRVISMTKMGV